MSTRRSKRLNENEQGGSAAKRTATQENGVAKSNQDDSIQRAQASMDRLDFKTGVEICREILESNPLDPTPPLLLRSFGLERLGQAHEAAKDVEKALKTKETRETHLRATFNFLALALHHLEIAQQLPPQEDEMTTSHLMESDLAELKQEIKKSKDRQLKSPFDRLSAELFVKTMSFSDSPSLSISTSVSKTWNKSILEAKSLFRHFKMEGKVSNIMKAIKIFGQRSGNSIESIELKIGTEATRGEQNQLQESMTPSTGTLKFLSISHEGDISNTILKVASKCTKLTSLISNKSENEFHPTSESEPPLALPLPWNPKLQTFNWQAGGSRVICDDSLIAHLQDCRIVTLCSGGIQPAWVIKLLSSNSKLVTVQIPWIEDGTVTDIPPMTLPDLEILYLDHAPRSEDRMENENGNGNANANVKVDGSTFFRRLCAPALITLNIYSLDPRDLSGLRSASIEVFSVWRLIEASPRPEEAALSLISSMKNWNRLSQLEILLDHSIPSAFWNRLICLLTILSKESIRAGYKDFFFPRLVKFKFASTDQSPISAVDLSSMVASRIAVQRKLSYKNVFLSAQGDCEACFTDPPRAGSDEEVPFADLTTRSIRTLTVKNPIEGNKKALARLLKRTRLYGL